MAPLPRIVPMGTGSVEGEEGEGVALMAIAPGATRDMSVAMALEGGKLTF